MGLGDEGAKSLAINTTITILDVSENEIGYKGAKSFLHNITLTDLDIDTPEGMWKRLSNMLDQNYQRRCEPFMMMFAELVMVLMKLKEQRRKRLLPQ